MKRYLSLLIALLVLIAIIAVLETVNMPFDNLFWSEVYNFGHVPLFGILALALLPALKTIIKTGSDKYCIYYILAFFISGLLGAASELLQFFGPRDADIWDFIRDCVGALSFLIIYSAFDNSLKKYSLFAAEIFRRALFAAGILLIFITIVPSILWAIAFIHRDRAFPVICTFESYWERKFAETENARLQACPPPAAWTDKIEGLVGKLTLNPADYPGLVIEDPYSDWSAYGIFTFQIFSVSDTSFNLTVRIDDSHHDNTYEDRYNREFLILPGLNLILITVDEIISAPTHRLMDIKSIKAIHVFAVAPDKQFYFYIDDFRLM